jgi:two-component system phosphate regulon sensor histidine kinase PhoR
MRKRRLLRQLLPTYLLLSFLALATLGWFAIVSLKDFYLDQTAQNLSARALLVVDLAQTFWDAGPTPQLDRLCKGLGEKTATRITLIREDGEVVGDSAENPSRMDNHADRPEVQEALQGRQGKSIRFSRTLQQKMMYVAVPVRGGDRVMGVVRTSLPVTSIDRVFQTFEYRIFVGIFLIALISAGFAFMFTQRIIRPLGEIRLGAERFARNELDYRVEVPDVGEIGAMAAALNQMAAQLKERIDTVEKQRNELEALLSGMVESVIAVDPSKRVISMNRAAAEMFDVDAAEVKGQMLPEIVRNIELQEFVEEVLKSRGIVEQDLALYTGTEQYLQAHGTLLRDAVGRKIGVLIVLNDVTRIRSLENVRRDFFDNVSHELKTPITSIKGYIETLLDGTAHKPEDVHRFQEIILQQSERLSSLVEDLLSLSRIEQEAEHERIELQRGKVSGVIHSALRTCAVKAEGREIHLEADCDPSLEAKINAHLLEQAIQNLIDNAIKYSERGKTVRIEGGRKGTEVFVRVTDQGYGIPQEHLPRLFERFYRVDKARSRRLGGTGLGLAIVKHIVQAHGGRITVESALQKGSIFTIFLPQV